MSDSAIIAGRSFPDFTYGLFFIAGCVSAIVGFVPVGVGLLVIFTGQATEVIGGSLTLRDMGFATFLATPFYGLAAMLLRKGALSAGMRSTAGSVFAVIAAGLLAVQVAFASAVTLSAPFCVAGLSVPLLRWVPGCHPVAGPVLLASGVGLLVLLLAGVLRGRHA